MAFKYSFEKKKDYTLITLEGSLLSVFEGTELLKTIGEDLNDSRHFIIDLGKVAHLSSEGLNVLINILTKSRNADGETILCNLSTHLESLFIITKLSNIFTITKDKKEAAAKLKAVDSK